MKVLILISDSGLSCVLMLWHRFNTLFMQINIFNMNLTLYILSIAKMGEKNETDKLLFNV